MLRRMISRLATIVIMAFLCKKVKLKFNTFCSHANLRRAFKSCSLTINELSEITTTALETLSLDGDFIYVLLLLTMAIKYTLL